MNKINIAVIGLKGLPAFGGAATVGENLVNELKSEYDFTVLSISSHTNLSTGIYQGINQIVFKGNDISGINTLIYYLKCMFYCLFRNEFDLIYLHHSASGFITPILKLKYKVLVTFHGIFSNKTDPKFNKLINKFFRISERLNIHYADTIVSVSKSDAAFCEKYYHRRIHYIPNAININKKYIKNISDYICFSASRIYEIKGLHILLGALKKNNWEKKIIVIGNLEHVSQYKQQIIKQAEGLNVEFLGIISDKEKLFSIINQASLFIFPSIYEAMSMMLLEVVSIKTPVIASDIESNKSIFNEKEILFFKSENVDDLSKKISWASDNYPLMQKMAENAYKKLEKEYTWDKIAQSYKSLIDSLTSRH